MVRCETFLQGFRIMSFLLVIKVSTVSGEASAYLMRSQLMARGLPLRRVSLIMCGVPSRSLIGRETAINRCGRQMPGDQEGKRGTGLKSAKPEPMRWGNAEPSAW